MNRVGQFQKVSFAQFYKDWNDTFGETKQADCQTIYEQIRLPVRATEGSAGYDFMLPLSVTLKPGQTMLIPTGIRVRMEPGWMLAMFPRSGLGFRYRMQLNNTVGIIDTDYFDADNEGHIMARITNDSRENRTMCREAGTGFLQGIFLPFGITVDDAAEGKRSGGFGSTDFTE